MACSDVQTIQAGNGTKTQFSFDFPYIFKSEIHVYFWNAVTKEYDEKLTTDATYPWQITDANPTIVEFTGTAPPSPATPVDPGEPTVDNVKIRRITKVDDIRALFNPGSAIRSDDLNKNFEQLRYAIQEANCQGIPDDVDAYLKDYYWDRYDNTLYDGDTWVSDDTKIATTAALDARFQDEVNDTFTKAELSAASNIMPDDDVAVPTTGALNDYINEVITNDIAGSDGVSITDDGDGTITIGLTDNTVDFDKIKDSDQIKLADQVSDPDAVGTDNNIFTAQAATRRFNNYYQNDAPSTTDGIGIGQVWVDPNDDLTLSVWSGSSWVGITSGGTFTNQPKVIYVDATSGDDTNDGHRISRPKKTIEAALNDINSDSVYGDGSIISVAPGIYAETLPLDIQKNDVGIIGQSLRTCIIHPKIPTSDHATYDVDTPHSQELQTMFRVNSGSYFTNLTLTGLKASGTRGGNSLYTDSTYGLPTNQGWNFGFYPNSVIKKSPYIQNVTNFSDSQINNVTFTPHTPGEGAAGDLDSAPCGGGILVDGSVPSTSSPLRSMVCDSYTHTALDGPGIFVTNNGYCQATSSYAFFNHAHITCVNGGQANLAASTTDFGRFGLIADGKSSTAIFTSNVDGAANSGATTFNINAPAAGSGWFGDATRPQDNMLVTVNSVTYPVISASSYTDSEGGAGWTVTISRPDPNDTSSNLGLNGAVSDNAAVSFFLRSMIASSGHTMEYVGSGTDYTALPENGGVPVDSNQLVERNDGKVWSAITDHKGTFKLGNFFTIDQQAGSLSINDGSFKVNLETLDVDVSGNAVFGAPLDMGSNQITSSSGNLKLNANGDIDAQTNKIINVTDPTAAQDAATKNYVDNNFIGEVVDDGSPQLGGNLDVNGNEIISTSNGDITINPNGTGDIVLDANVGIGTASPGSELEVSSTGNTGITIRTGTTTGNGFIDFTDGAVKGQILYDHNSNYMRFYVNGSEQMRIDGSGNVGIGATSPDRTLHVRNDDAAAVKFGGESGSGDYAIEIGQLSTGSSPGFNATGGAAMLFRMGGSEAMRIDSSGRLGIGTSTHYDSSTKLTVEGRINTSNGTITGSMNYGGGTVVNVGTLSNHPLQLMTNNSTRMYLDTSGNVGIGTTSPSSAIGSTPVVEISGTYGGLALSSSVPSANKVEIGNYGYNTMVFATNSSERMRIDSSGRLLVGLTNDLSGGLSTATIQSVSAGGAFVSLGRNDTTVGSDNGIGGLRFYSNDPTASTYNDVGIIQCVADGTHDAGDYPTRLEFHTTADGASSPTERMRIDSSGRLLVGTATQISPSFGFKLSAVFDNNSLGGIALKATASGSSRMLEFINNSGSVQGSIQCTGSATAYNTSSDYRLKENVTPVTDGITRLQQLKPSRFNFIADPDKTVDGFLAHEVQTIVPEAITGEKDAVDDEGNPQYQGIDQSKLVPLLTAALQEAVAKIETLEQRLTDAGL